MKKTFAILFVLLTVISVNAQIVKGDMDGDGQITMADANEVTNTYLGKKAVEHISFADNNKIQGTWYETKTKTKTITFNANGTTDFTSCAKFSYYPEIKALIFFDRNGKLLSFRNIHELTENNLFIDTEGNVVNYTKTKPVYKVTSITLSETNLIIAPDGYEVLTATVFPEDADNKSVTWSSSNTDVAMVLGEGRIIPLKTGQCVISCTANDGSGIKAECTLTVADLSSKTKLVSHVPQAIEIIGEESYDISQYNSCRLDDLIKDYCENPAYAENQVFYLEGGKAYHFSSYCYLYKGLTLETNPEDIAAGKPKAILYMGGMTSNGSYTNTANFILGRLPRENEDPDVLLQIDTIRFKNLDVQVPLAHNYGHNYEGIGSVTSNYFINMFANCLGLNVNSLEWDNCTFQGFIRGFFRVQGVNDFNINNIKLKNCQFYNNGYYFSNDYGYIYADMNTRTKSCILKNVEICNNVFYDSPKASLVTDANRNIMWDSSVKWNVDVHHNTFVNWNTQYQQPIINTRYVPGGSKLSFHENLIILTRDERDVNRQLFSTGWDTRYIQGGDGSDHAYFLIYDNYSTNDNLTNGQVFSVSAFSAKSNAPGKWVYGWKADGTFETYFPYGEAGLIVTADNISATELMVDPNPKHFIGAKASSMDHHTDTGIQGLFYQQTSKVKNSEIYKKGIGAPMLSHMKDSEPVNNTHEYVDLGLSVKWATCNVGASKPEEYGNYFAWGETTGYSQDTSDGHQFTWANYSLCNGSETTMKKYCTNSYYGNVDDRRLLDKEDDAASVNWGGSWRMPTQAEQDELRNTSNCTWTWTTMNGVNGYKVVSKKNGNSIFLPAAGYRDDNSIYNASYTGSYLSSSLAENSSYACGLSFISGYFTSNYYDRCGGRSVRAVCP